MDQTIATKIKEKDYSYAKFLKYLLACCRQKHFDCKKIGTENFDTVGIKYPIYRIIINPDAKKKFCIISGVQAYEIAGPLSILETIKNHAQDLNDKINYHIIPVLNPVSFDLRQRFDEEGHDLNTINRRTLHRKAYKEVQITYHDIKRERYGAFLSLHEDMDSEKFYAYVFEKKRQKIYRQVINAAQQHCNIWESKKIYGIKSNGKGLIINHYDQSFEDKMFRTNHACLSLCTETPGKIPITTRIAINREIMRLLTKHILESNSFCTTYAKK